MTTPNGIPHDAFISGETHPRNTQHLGNVAYLAELTWANPTQTSLEIQASGPMFNTSTASTIVELGLTDDSFLSKLSSDSIYQTLFTPAYGEDSYSNLNVRKAISAFQRTMLTGNSSYDRFIQFGESLSSNAISGAEVFFGNTTRCSSCHNGTNFNESTGRGGAGVTYNNIGLYTQAEFAAKNSNERGLVDVTGLSDDEGKFRTPSLRNISVTFPYMHDGTITCDAVYSGDDTACARNALEKVIDHYMSGGKSHPAVNTNLIRAFSLTTQEKSDLIDFLMALQDDTFLTNTKFGNPRPSNANFGL